MRRTLGYAVVVALVLAAPSLATGNGPSKAVYNKSGSNVQAVVGKSGTTGTAAAPAGKPAVSPAKAGNALPFTGLDLGFVVGAGLVLVATGFSLRRLTRKPPTA